MNNIVSIYLTALWFGIYYVDNQIKFSVENIVIFKFLIQASMKDQFGQFGHTSYFHSKMTSYSFHVDIDIALIVITFKSTCIVDFNVD